MKKTLKAIPLYLALVGLPVVGLLVILHFGQQKQAPRSIGGRWAVEWSADRAEACTFPEEVVVSQSGKRLSLRLTGSAGQSLYEGRIRKDSVSAWPLEQACRPDRSDLQAHVVGTGAGTQIQGTLYARSCSCKPISLKAVPKGRQGV